MYFLSYLFKFMPLYFISHFSSWLGLACIVMFLIFIVHSYVAPTLNKLNNTNVEHVLKYTADLAR